MLSRSAQIRNSEVASRPRPAKIALLGCGAVSRLYYLPALRELERRGFVQVVAAFDPNPASLVSIGTAFPVASAVDRLDAIWESGAELAIVASPPRFHAEQTIRALDAGLAVLCEKPMASTVQEGEAMIQAAKAAHRVLAIGLYRRFLPAAQTIKAMLSTGALGDVIDFTCFEGGSFKWPVASPRYFDRDVSGGGVLMDIGAHVLDLLIWWLGEPISIAYEDDAMGGIEANCRIQLRFYEGHCGTIQLSRDWTRPNQYLFQCTKGWFAWDVNEAESVQMGVKGDPFVLDARLRVRSGKTGLGPKTSTPNFQRSFIEQIHNVIAAAREGGKVVVSGEEGLRSLRLIDHCYCSRRLMLMPWLGDREQKRAEILATRPRP